MAVAIKDRETSDVVEVVENYYDANHWAIGRGLRPFLPDDDGALLTAGWDGIAAKHASYRLSFS